MRRRRALLVAALGFTRARVADPPPVLLALRGWLGGWRGIGLLVTGMERQGD